MSLLRTGFGARSESLAVVSNAGVVSRSESGLGDRDGLGRRKDSGLGDLDESPRRGDRPRCVSMIDDTCYMNLRERLVLKRRCQEDRSDLKRSDKS